MMEGPLRCPDDPIPFCAIAHLRLGASHKWTKAQFCTDTQYGSLK